MGVEPVAQQKWTDIWPLFDTEEQRLACKCYLESLEPKGDGAARALLERLADATKFRISEVNRLLTQNPEKLADMLRPKVASVMNEDTWRNLFRRFYFAQKSGLMSAFLDGAGIGHDGRGGVGDGVEKPSAEASAAAVEKLLKIYTVKEVARYFCVLARQDSLWSGVIPERDRLLALNYQSAPPKTKIIDPAAAGAIADASGEFSVLDRLIIQETVRSVASVNGSLDEEGLQDLVETILRLNDQWHRAYFHLGFMDVLVPSRNLQFDRPEDNDHRAGWYLAGVITALARSHATERVRDLLDHHRNIFLRCVANPGGAGAAIASTGFAFLIEASCFDQALAVLRGQLSFEGLKLAQAALSIATDFIRDRNFEPGKAIVDVLSKHEFDVDEQVKDDFPQFVLNVERRRGQCLQAAGDFDNAERAFRKLLDSGEENSSPDLLADLGLVKARVRTLDDLLLPDAPESRINLRDALARGEAFFRRGLETFGVNAPKAAYALAVLLYSRWALERGGERQREAKRSTATQAVETAIMSMRSSQWEGVYRDIGVLARSHFMLAVLKMHSLDAVDGREAITAWRSITESAGLLPKQDIRALLNAAEMHDSALAVEIAESVWRYRKEEAIEILRDGSSIYSSPELMEQLLSLAKSESSPRAERVKLWCSLIPGLIRQNEIHAAQEGLDELEGLSDDPVLAPVILEFISDPHNTDPAWSPMELIWARLRLLRNLGKDAECTEILRRRFYAVRDSAPWEADQILAAADDWGIDSDVREEIASRMPHKLVTPIDGVEARLIGGESVRILFVGGNETQAQYDQQVVESLRVKWPGIDVQFEHTGWSSNWGRLLERLLTAGNAGDAVVLMYMMRTMLGRRFREGLTKPWIPCTSTGKGGMLASLSRAAVVGVEQRLKRGEGARA